MLIEYDAVKNAENIAQRNLSFDLVALFNWKTAVIEPDTRRDYGEARFQATGFIGSRLHRVVFTWRGNVARIISFRRANPREEKYYATQTRSRVDR